jgi:hypothetical protein
MKLRSFVTTLALVSLSFSLGSCGGGGGGSTSGSSSSGRQLLVTANVLSDSCGERLAGVRQIFTVLGNGELDTSIFTVPVSSDGGTISASYSDTNGDCQRSYTVTLDGADSSAGQAELTARTNCGSVSCETRWVGTFSETNEPKISGPALKVRGENCNPVVPTEVGYRPSAYECNGAAAVLLGGALRNNYSVVVRRNGKFNDRDPNNPTCGTNRCSPYKTQRKIELPQYQVNCLGDNGFSSLYAEVNRISVKFFGKIEDANDPNQFEQWCLANTTRWMN